MNPRTFDLAAKLLTKSKFTMISATCYLFGADPFLITCRTAQLQSASGGATVRLYK